MEGPLELAKMMLYMVNTIAQSVFLVGVMLLVSCEISVTIAFPVTDDHSLLRVEPHAAFVCKKASADHQNWL
jgi:hypothetical protein